MTRTNLLTALAAGTLSLGLAFGFVGCSSSELGDITEGVMVARGKTPEEAEAAGRAVSGVTGAVGDIDPAAEARLGQTVALKIFSSFGPLVQDDDLQEYVNLVGQGVARSSSQPNLDWIFAVIAHDTPTAIAAPGGVVIITTGLLETMESEAQLAGVLAHEVSHVTEGHLRPLYRGAMLGDAVQAVESYGGREDSKYSNLADMLVNKLINEGLGPAAEYEADLLGSEVAAVTGYDPQGLESLLADLPPRASKGWSSSTHPPTNERIARLRNHRTANFPDLTGAKATERFQDRASGPYPTPTATPIPTPGATTPAPTPAPGEPVVTPGAPTPAPTATPRPLGSILGRPVPISPGRSNTTPRTNRIGSTE